MNSVVIRVVSSNIEGKKKKTTNGVVADIDVSCEDDDFLIKCINLAGEDSESQPVGRNPTN